MRPRALDLYCGGGGVSEGLLRAGFDVVGVDLDPRRARAYNRGPGNPDRHERPAVFVQADALTVLEGLISGTGVVAVAFGPFDFVWASPPCQAHSVLRNLQPGKEYPDLIPATRERLQAAGIPYAIENVPGAPLGGFLTLLCGTMFGLQTPDGRAELRRHRLFETSWPIALRPACQHGHVAMEAIGVTGTGNPTGSLNSHRKPESISVCGTGMGPGNRGKEEHQRAKREVLSVVGQKGLPGLSQKRRRASSISGHASEISPSNWNGRRKALPVTGHSHHTGRGANRETFSTSDARHAMGIDWMAMKDLSQAIPPTFARWIGLRALEEIAAQHAADGERGGFAP